RVQAIIRELRGEKIDIVEYSEDPVTFVTNALSPARVQRVSIVDDRERVMEVVVEDKQLSLAIGKKGQNVRLAAKLTGWRIDIKSEEEKRREIEAQFDLSLGAAGEPEPLPDIVWPGEEPGAAGEPGAGVEAGAVEPGGSAQAAEETAAGAAEQSEPEIASGGETVAEQEAATSEPESR